jgi:hypothetical protein
LLFGKKRPMLGLLLGRGEGPPQEAFAQMKQPQFDKCEEAESEAFVLS